ncbi:MAG: S-adenosylmethionine:tRNA ribosyltransferase-isomerase [Bacteroidales bacterium]|nr:S-adenosylmethionine:tRNA ribosyltransferase-isomerase [Bacteroidales bacterium]
MIPDIKIEDYNYVLPDERIAKYPLSERDSSKLLVYKDGACTETVFKNLPQHIPSGSMMVFNDTKVVPARLFFKRPTGAHIEIFCLEPDTPSEYNTNFATTGNCRWKCVIGNSKRLKDNELLDLDSDSGEFDGISPKARLISRDGQTGIVEFSWQGGIPFSELLERCGRIPIPPYLNRATEAIDIERYQTLYAHIRGSVAAPTAGLHFTSEVLEAIAGRGVDIENVCLHVGAGTFLPVKSSTIASHPMHREPFSVSRNLLCRILSATGGITAVGTTSVRTLESLYYAGASCIEKGHPEDVTQWAPYEREWTYSTKEALEALVKYLDDNGLDKLQIGTRIIIVPGFDFRLVDRMVTNFHQPQSTLLLLISAFVGGDWQTIYNYALGHGFRFLSYGDSSLLFRR